MKALCETLPHVTVWVHLNVLLQYLVLQYFYFLLQFQYYCSIWIKKPLVAMLKTFDEDSDNGPTISFSPTIS